ncbi:MAG: CoA ester lyase [Magnetococcus sp. DMHC-6]
MTNKIPSLLRSVLYVPASNPRALEKSAHLGADGLIFDLEDSVAPNAKPLARQQALATLRLPMRPFRTVRLNGLQSAYWQEDLKTILPGHPDAIILPKMEQPVELDSFILFLQNLEQAHSLNFRCAIWPMIETPIGVQNSYELARRARVGALVMGTSDLGNALRLRLGKKDRQPLYFALQQTILAARAAEVAVFDGVFVDLTDPEGFKEECEEGARLGFDGKTVIHPSQVQPANQAFLPTAHEIAKAQHLRSQWLEAESRGEEICLVDGQLVERLHVEQAERMIHLWQQSIK